MALLRQLFRTERAKLQHMLNDARGNDSDLEAYPTQQRFMDGRVRLGIRGWAQCHGRNAISWKEKFKLDVWYVDYCKLWTELRVIFITIKRVLMRTDINSATAVTMVAFNGNN